jgi:putative transposase
MKTKRHSDSQIQAILKAASDGKTVPEVCREYGISSATFYKWRSKYAGADAGMIKRVRELELELSRLKRMYSDAQLDNDILKEVLAKKP